MVAATTNSFAVLLARSSFMRPLCSVSDLSGDFCSKQTEENFNHHGTARLLRAVRPVSPFSYFVLFVLLPLCSVSAQILINTEEIYTHKISNFSSSTVPLTFYGLARHDQHGALQLTSSPRGSNAAGANKTGVVILNKPLHLGREYIGSLGNSSYIVNTASVSTLSTTFDMSISRVPSCTTADSPFLKERDGSMSFVAFEQQLPTDLNPELNGTELSTNCHRCDGIMAIQFDLRNDQMSILTRQSEGTATVLSPYENGTIVFSSDQSRGIGLSYPNRTVVNHTVWIDVTCQFCRNLEPDIQVFIGAQGSLKPTSPVLSVPLEMQGNIYYGFTGSRGNNEAVVITVGSWNLSVMTMQYQDTHKIPHPDPSRVPTRVIIATSVSGAALLVAIAFMGIFVWKKKRETDFLGQALKSLPGMPMEFKYAELKKATDNFSDQNKLGQGGFGQVYKGKLPEEGKIVAIKKFLRETDQGGFLAELTIINRLRHRNLVRLLGWSHQNKKLLLVYDYMPNGSLDKHLFNQQNGTTLSWMRRYKILVGVASALHYLHNEFNQKVVHRDLKASNIMLDADYDACLGDFGLARAIDNDRTSYAEGGGIPGTWGYIAPECLLTGKATRESDVYGFGAVVLEVVCGRRPGTQINNFRLLVDWVWALHTEMQDLQAVDPRLMNEYDENDAQRLLLLGLACSHPVRTARPKADEILQIMQKSLSPPDVPFVKPPFMMETMSFDDDYHPKHDSTGVIEVPTCVEDPLFSSENRSCGA